MQPEPLAIFAAGVARWVVTDAQGSLNGGLDPLARSPALRRRRGRVAVTVVLSAVATLTVISWSTSALEAGNRSAAAAAPDWTTA